MSTLDAYFEIIQAKNSQNEAIKKRFSSSTLKSTGGMVGKVKEINDGDYQDLIFYGVAAQMLGSATNQAKTIISNGVTISSAQATKNLESVCSNGGFKKSIANQIVARFLQVEVSKAIDKKTGTDEVDGILKEHPVIGLPYKQELFITSLKSSFKTSTIQAPMAFYFHSLLIPTKRQFWNAMIKDAENASRPQYANYIINKVCKGIRVVIKSEPSLNFEDQLVGINVVLTVYNKFKPTRATSGSDILSERRVSDNLFTIKNGLTSESNENCKKILTNMIIMYDAVDIQVGGRKDQEEKKEEKVVDLSLD